MRRYGRQSYARSGTKARNSGLAAAAHARIAPLQLLDVKIFAAQRSSAALVFGVRLQISVVSSIATPFPHPEPQARNRLLCPLERTDGCSFHQSPSAPAAQRVATYGASCSTRTIPASATVTTASRRWLKIKRCVSAILAAGIFPAASCAVIAFAAARN